MWRRMADYANKKLSPSRKELLATQDVTIYTRKRMRIYAYCNLFCFIFELLIFGIM